jgi:hypothetical protein
MGIEVTTLKSEFGTYIGTNQQQIMKLLTQKTVSQNFMTTIMSKDLKWRAAKAVIDDLVQGFQKAWTAKGTATFTPLSLEQRRHKIDFEFYPDDVFESWLGFLTDEKTDRKTWPISRYIIEQLIVPKVAANRELLLIGKGVYAEPAEGVAQATGLSMDGFCTILKAKRALGTSNINFFNDATTFPGVPTAANIVDFLEAFVDWIGVLYQGMNLPIFESNDWYKKYQRKYRELYGINMDYSKAGAGQIDFASNPLQPLPSMAGENVFFVTPKENFIRLINANEGASNITVESIDRKIKVFADWHESVGFGIEEAIFAYVPDETSASA